MVMSFRRFLSEKALSFTELTKRANFDIFATRFKGSHPFFIEGGKGEVVFDEADFKGKTFTPKDLTDKEKMREFMDLLQSKNNGLVMVSKGKRYKLSDIQKDGGFGGKDKTGTEVETAEIAGIETFMKENEGFFPGTMKIGKFTVKDVAGVRKVDSLRSRADFEFFDSKGKGIFWVSHKDGDSPKRFQQLSGITKEGLGVSPDDTPEVKAFIADVKAKVGDTMPNGAAFMREIKSKDLKVRAMYGPEPGKSFSMNNCQVVIQGNMRLEIDGDLCTLTAHHIFNNPELPGGEYELVFQARRGESTRKNGGINFCRMGVNAKGNRKAEFI